MPFNLQCRSMRGPDIYLYDIISQHKIYMVQTLFTERAGLGEDQLRLILRGSILEDNQSLEFYNVNNHSIILVVEPLYGGPRRRIPGLSGTLLVGL